MLQVYLTDLAAYNAGSLVGRWVQLPITGFELSQAISEVLSEGEQIAGEENHEGWFITDYEWIDILLFKVEEYSNIFELNSAIQALESLEAYLPKALAFLMAEGLVGDIYDAILQPTAYNPHTLLHPQVYMIYRNILEQFSYLLEPLSHAHNLNLLHHSS